MAAENHHPEKPRAQVASGCRGKLIYASAACPLKCPVAVRFVEMKLVGDLGRVPEVRHGGGGCLRRHNVVENTKRSAAVHSRGANE